MKLYRRNMKRKGFTLIELLIVILVLAILMAVALPLYLSAVSDSQLKTCRSNMQTIANAEQAYKTSNRAHVYTTTLTDLNPNLGSTPICPSAGAYSVTISTGANTDGLTLTGAITAMPGSGLTSLITSGVNGVLTLPAAASIIVADSGSQTGLNVNAKVAGAGTSLTKTGVAVCGGPVVQPLAGRTEGIGPRN